jgi:hypothetical protein
MKRMRLLVVTMSASVWMWAGSKPAPATIVSENSVDCGTEAHGHKQKDKVDLVCQEYVIRTATTEYHVRQPKQHDQGLLPLSSPIEYTLDKDKMKFKLDGKSYEFLVVSEAAIDAKKP